MPDVSAMYHCCVDCQGLLNSAAALKHHRIVCTGVVRDTQVAFYACPRSKYVLLQKYSEKEIIFLLHHHLLADILQECHGVPPEEKSQERREEDGTERGSQEDESKRSSGKEIGVKNKGNRLCEAKQAQQNTDSVDEEGDNTNSFDESVDLEESSVEDSEEFDPLQDTAELGDLKAEEISPVKTTCVKGQVVTPVSISDHSLAPVSASSDCADNQSQTSVEEAESASNGQISLALVVNEVPAAKIEPLEDKSTVKVETNTKASGVKTTDSSSVPELDVDLASMYHKYCTEDKTYSCPHCSAVISSLGFFHRHMTIKHGRSLLCDHCGATLPNKTQLLLHQNKHTRPFTCPHCGRGFARKIDRDRHVMIHDGKYPFKCDICDYKCRSHCSMSAHTRKHEGNLLHCTSPGCDFATNHPWTLKQHHMAKHESHKRFECEQCGYSTSDSSSYRRHQMRHQGIKDFQCSQCSFRARTRHDVLRHMRRHTGEKVYQCDRCSFCTSHSYALRRHMMSHLGVKPWQCSDCGFEHTKRSKVAAHVEEQHPEAQVVSMGLQLNLNSRQYMKRKYKDSEEEEEDYIYHVPECEQQIILDMYEEQNQSAVEGLTVTTESEPPVVVAVDEVSTVATSVEQSVVVAEESDVLFMVAMEAGSKQQLVPMVTAVSGEQPVTMETTGQETVAMESLEPGCMPGVPQEPVTVETVYQDDVEVDMLPVTIATTAQESMDTEIGLEELAAVATKHSNTQDRKC